jgi:CRISPR type III-A-associated RAMP protein Csm4
MNPGLAVKLRPTGPWRIGPDSGARNQVDSIYHSDSLYSAITSALARIGLLDDWLEATARNGVPAVCFSSCFPFVDEIGFVVPPRTIWPPSSPALLAAHVRWKSARFIPLGIVPALLAGQTLAENEWAVDGTSGCLLPAGRPGPWRTGVRFNAALDRLTGTSERHSVACIEFRPGAGLWAVVSFAGEDAHSRWIDPLKTAFRWLADSGFGGERSRGWGRSEEPEFTEGTLPEMILAGGAPPSPEAAAELESAATPNGVRPQWLLSLFSPAPADSVDWERGNYSVVERCGRVESPAGWGGLKKHINMVAEGSVLYAASSLRGAAPDVAPEGFAHPVFRAGFAVAIPLPEVS